MLVGFSAASDRTFLYNLLQNTVWCQYWYRREDRALIRNRWVMVFLLCVCVCLPGCCYGPQTHLFLRPSAVPASFGSSPAGNTPATYRLPLALFLYHTYLYNWLNVTVFMEKNAKIAYSSSFFFISFSHAKLLQTNASIYQTAALGWISC